MAICGGPEDARGHMDTKTNDVVLLVVDDGVRDGSVGCFAAQRVVCLSLWLTA
jgi:hypothetical protein